MFATINCLFASSTMLQDKCEGASYWCAHLVEQYILMTILIKTTLTHFPVLSVFQ